MWLFFPGPKHNKRHHYVQTPAFNRLNEGAPPTTLSIIGTKYITINPVTITSPDTNFFVCVGSVNFDTFGFYMAPVALTLQPAIKCSDWHDDSGPGSLSFAITYNFTVPALLYCCLSLQNASTGSYILTTSEPGALPVRLISFTAEATGGKNLLKWIGSRRKAI
jgi:hypothetical protein